LGDLSSVSIFRAREGREGLKVSQMANASREVVILSTGSVWSMQYGLDDASPDL
jgi:hypothetical protein